MFLKIVDLEKLYLVGMQANMSWINDGTPQLWRSFMPRRAQIKNRVEGFYYSVNDYPEVPGFLTMQPNDEFTKWAAVEVDTVGEIPQDMEAGMLSGLYAVFLHKGTPSDFKKTFDYILKDWLPKSGYTIDDRVHFEKLPEGYNPMSADSTEEIWIPIKKIP